MTLNILSILIVGSLIGIGVLPAGTDFSQCRLPKRVIMTKSLSEIPSSILAHMPGLGAANDAILSSADDPSDPINDNVPSVRLAGAFSEGGRWAVVYEAGDFANSRTVALFSVTQEKASRIGQHAGLQEPGVCAILKRAFPD